jgi:signal peptidase I
MFMAGLMGALHLWVVTTLRVSSGSMAPGITAGSTVVVDKVSRRFSGWRDGEVVVFHNPVDGALTIKRIVAGPGQTISIENQVLIVDGAQVAEPYADSSHVGGLYFGPVTVPRDSYFVLGDNRSGSIDSRVFGPIRGDAITGRMILSWRIP